MEILALNSLVEFSKRLNSVKKYNPNLSYKYLLPTFKDGRVKKSSEILKMLKTHYKEIVCDPIHYSSKLSETAGFGKTIFEYDKKSAQSQPFCLSFLVSYLIFRFRRRSHFSGCYWGLFWWCLLLPFLLPLCRIYFFPSLRFQALFFLGGIG